MPSSSSFVSKRLAVVAAVATILLSLFDDASAAFVHNIQNHNSCSSSSSSHRRGSVIRHLTSDEILAQARKKTGINTDEDDEEPAPKLFEDELLDDMRDVLVKLETRITEGPGALSRLEVNLLARQLNRITVEMRINQDKKPPRPVRQEPEQADTQAAVAPAAPQAPARPAQPSFSAPVPSASVVGSNDNDYNAEEGPAFDGRGGMGQPKDTVNTYIIPGMDAMSPEEYQEALQKSVSDRQRIRRATTVVGNRSSQNYLDALSRKPNNDE